MVKTRKVDWSTAVNCGFDQPRSNSIIDLVNDLKIRMRFIDLVNERRYFID